MQNIAQARGREITAVYAHNDEMALGAIEGLKAAGIAQGRAVLVVSVDGERAALEAIERGELGATVESNPASARSPSTPSRSCAAARASRRRSPHRPLLRPEQRAQSKADAY
jgi:hypothetical protein